MNDCESAESELHAAQARFEADPSFTNLLAVQALLQKQTRSYFAFRRALSPTRTAQTASSAPRVEINVATTAPVVLSEDETSIGETAAAKQDQRALSPAQVSDEDREGTEPQLPDTMRFTQLRSEKEECERLRDEQALVLEQLRATEDQNRLLEEQLAETVQRANKAAAGKAAASGEHSLRLDIASAVGAEGSADLDVAWGDEADDPLD